MKKLFTLFCAMVFAIVANAADTYTVVGSSQLQGGGKSWDEKNTTGDMVANGDGSYSLTLTDVALEANTTYEYKVVKNHTWNSAAITTNEWSDHGSNCKLTVPATAKYKVVITLTPDDANQNVPQTTVSKTGEIGEITHTYTVAGGGKLFNSTWKADNEEGKMSLDESTGLYTITLKNKTLNHIDDISAGDHSDQAFKVCVDGSFSPSYPDNNWVVNPEADGNYDVTITFDANTHNITVNTKKTGSATAEHKYYVIGGKTFFGENAWKLDAAREMTFDANTGKYRCDFSYADLTKADENTTDAMKDEQSFKVLCDKSWDNSKPDGGNYYVGCPVSGKFTVTVMYEPKNGKDSLNAYVYDVAVYGDAALFVHDWDQAARVQMSIDLASGTKYSVTINNLTLSKGTHYQYKVLVGGNTSISYPEGEGNNATISVEKDGIYNVTITFDANSNTPTATTSFVKDATITHDYYLVGSQELGLSWAAADARKMTKNETTGRYECTLTNVTLAKVDPFDGQDHSNQGIKVLDNKLYSAGYPFGDKNNYIVNPDADGTYDVVVSFDPNAADDDENKLTCTFNQIITHTYSVYGAKELIGGDNDWDVASAKEMSANGTDSYILTLDNLTLARNIPYQFKVMVDGDVNNSYPNGLGQNESVTVGEDGIYTVTITFNASTHAIVSSFTKTGDAQIEHKYYVVGGEALGLSWTATDGIEMTLNNATGLYEYVIDKVALKHIANTSDESYKATQDFKVLDNRSWSAAYPTDGNYIINPDEDGDYKITITFNASESKASYILDKIVPTGINSINADNNIFVNVPVYNLAGQRVDKNYKGVVIVRGKKYILK